MEADKKPPEVDEDPSDRERPAHSRTSSSPDPREAPRSPRPLRREASSPSSKRREPGAAPRQLVCSERSVCQGAVQGSLSDP